jgi:hypothetical protein
MPQHLTIDGRHVVITTDADPKKVKLEIDGKDIPLVYHPGFKGWGVAHTIYGFFGDLAKLATHMIRSNPELIIGHGDDHDHPHH